MLKKILLSIAFILCLAGTTVAQRGWETNQWYQYQGQTWTEWQDVFAGYDFFGYPVYKRMCRQTTWYKEYRAGSTYVWGPSGWYTQWYEGYAWSCYWSNWYLCN